MSLVFAFFAGILTILAPCVLPILPLLLSGGGKSWKSSAMLMAGLGVSIFIFTLLIKTGTLIFPIPLESWKYFSALVIGFFGIFLLFPHLWELIMQKTHGSQAAYSVINSATQKQGLWGRFFLGASLAPLFSSCSPTYFLILGTVLPQNFLQGIIALLVYILGTVTILFLVVIFGQVATKKLKFFSNPNGLFKKILGIIFIMLAFSIVFGWDKKAEAWLLSQDWYWNSAVIETDLFY